MMVENSLLPGFDQIDKEPPMYSTVLVESKLYAIYCFASKFGRDLHNATFNYMHFCGDGSMGLTKASNWSWSPSLPSKKNNNTKTRSLLLVAS